MEIVQLIVDHGPKVLEIGTAIIATSSVVTAATKTPGKGKKIALIYKLIEIFALNVGRAKEKSE